jgi:hypothetical protein
MTAPTKPTEATDSTAGQSLGAATGSVDVWNAALDVAIKEINRMMYAPSARYDSLGRMTLTCAAKKIDELRKNPPNDQGEPQPAHRGLPN